MHTEKYMFLFYKWKKKIKQLEILEARIYRLSDLLFNLSATSILQRFMMLGMMGSSQQKQKGKLPELTNRNRSVWLPQ